VDFLDHDLLSSLKVHIKIFLVRGQKFVFKLLKHQHFLTNVRFWLLGIELRKSIALSSLNFLQGHEKYHIGSCPQFLYE
jgi:hypothetical protein